MAFDDIPGSPLDRGWHDWPQAGMAGTLPGASIWLPPEYLEPRQTQPGSPAWWRDKLCGELDCKIPKLQRRINYYEGRTRMAFATAQFRQTFGTLFAAFADNWAPIVVDASTERLTVEGFRFGEAGDSADKEAWSIWQANNLDADSGMAHAEAIKCGDAAIIVEPGEDERYPQITVEHPGQVIVASVPGARRRRAAALKRWIDEEGYYLATVYLPEGIYKYRSARPIDPWGGEVRWVERPRVPFETRNPLRVVPVIPLLNDPGMLAGGRSDLDTVIPLLDAINKLCSDMLVASEYAAFRQRVMTGVEVPTYPDDYADAALRGKPMKIDMGVSRLFTVAAPDAKVFDLAASDLNNYVVAIEMYVQHLAAQTHTPPHYLMGRIVNASGDALKAAETGLVAKVRRKMLHFGEAWEEAMRLAFRIRGGDDDDVRANAVDAETLWRNPEARSQAELADSLVKLSTIGVPKEVLWEEYGFSPQRIDRMKTMEMTDGLLNLTVPPPDPGATV